MSKRLYPDMAWFNQSKVLYQSCTNSFVSDYKKYNPHFFEIAKKTDIRNIDDPWEPSFQDVT